MSKRFTDTNKYKKPFIRGLQGPYKLLWDYLYHDCDNAGIWIVDFDIAQIYVGKDMPVNKEDALKYFNQGEQRIIELDGGTKWFIVPFIGFQYGQLSENNRAHNSVIMTLVKYNLVNVIKDLTSPLQGAMDMDMDMDKDKDIRGCGGKELNISFDDFWNLYDKKKGDKIKLEKKWRSFTNQEREAAMEYIPKYKEAQPDKLFRKDPATFLNNKSWNDEIIQSRRNGSNVPAKRSYKDLYAEKYG
jgi:hypothetical protein